MINDQCSFEEDISYLEEWSDSIQRSILDLKSTANERGVSALFSISCSKHYSFSKPYLTPLRLLENGVICGVVVFSLSQAVIAANNVKNVVDCILVDVEKKMGIQVGVSKKVLNHFGIFNKSISHISIGNISSAVRFISPNIKLIEYKPNDLTVDAVWTILSIKLKNLSGKKVAILGSGNIGFKLALKLVESGVNVVLYRRNSAKGMLMANAINIIKPQITTAMASFNPSAMEASSNCDVLIGAANLNTSIISWSMIQGISQGGFVVDIGKGSLKADTLKKALENDIDVFRADVTASLYGFISQMQQVENIVQNKFGRADVTFGVSIVSGGMIGRNGEVVVDSYNSPSLIYGVSDGCGNMKIELDKVDKENIEIVKKHIFLEQGKKI